MLKKIIIIEPRQFCVSHSISALQYLFFTAAPENFDIVHWTDSSISVEWYMNASDKSLEYQIDHRIQGSDKWNSLTLSAETVSTNEKSRYMYKLQKILPKTCYEVRICSVYKHVITKYTEPKTQQTLQIGKS